MRPTSALLLVGPPPGYTDLVRINGPWLIKLEDSTMANIAGPIVLCPRHKVVVGDGWHDKYPCCESQVIRFPRAGYFPRGPGVYPSKAGG
eukprot:5074828-Heterocapsa_arctica.AAC.1